MVKTILSLAIIIILAGCKSKSDGPQRVAVASVGNRILYLDQIPRLMGSTSTPTDSIALIQNYINSWARKELLYLKAEENLSDIARSEIEDQIRGTRENLVIYRYQRQMMLERMDTVITDEELESYYATNEKKFILSSNIVKALFIKLPREVPSVDRIRYLSRSTDPKDLQQLESICYQFAEKFDDFGDDWVTMDRLSIELPGEIPYEDQFLRFNTWYETTDSLSLYMITFRDYRLRYSLAPFDYVRNDIKNIILNNRRFEFLQSLENGIYNDGIRANLFKTY